MYATVLFWDDDYARNANIIGSSSNMRSNQLEESINIAMNNPFGIGYDYQSYARKTEKKISDELMGLESLFFKKLVEQGLVGLFAFFICLWLLYVEIRRYILIKKERFKLFAFTFGYLASITFTGVQGVSWHMFISLMFCFYHYYSRSICS